MLGIVIPALNEAATIASVVRQAREYGVPIVVDDGSTDETSRIAAAAGADVVRHETNRSYDKALESGFERAAQRGCDFVITMDADGQHNPRLLSRFLDELKSGADVVVGVRDRRQRISEHVFAWIAKKLWRIPDPLCGMKGYRVKVYRARGHFDAYGSIGTELAIYAARSGYRVSHIPVMTRDRGDAPRFGRALRANWRILRALLLAFGRAK